MESFMHLIAKHIYILLGCQPPIVVSISSKLNQPSYCPRNLTIPLPFEDVSQSQKVGVAFGVKGRAFQRPLHFVSRVDRLRLELPVERKVPTTLISKELPEVSPLILKSGEYGI